MYDIAIIGAGPAGLSAGITARAHNKQVVIISNGPQDNPLAKSKLVENYPGMPNTSGLNLLTTMTEQAETLGCEFMRARVIMVLPIESGGVTTFALTTSSDYIEAKSLILAVGVSVTKPLSGELEYLGRGVSYCAVCDGMLYRNSTVCVVGLSPEALSEAELLAELGATVHYLAPKGPARLTHLTRPARKNLVNGHTTEQKTSTTVQIREATVLAIEGDAMGVTAVRIREKSGGQKEAQKEAHKEGKSEAQTEAQKDTQTEEKSGDQDRESVIECQGVFILRPSIAPASLLASLELASGSIKVNKTMHSSIPGVFAAGDCTGKPLQIAKAVGEGQLACFSAVEYLETRCENS